MKENSDIAPLRDPVSSRQKESQAAESRPACRLEAVLETVKTRRLSPGARPSAELQLPSSTLSPPSCQPYWSQHHRPSLGQTNTSSRFKAFCWPLSCAWDSVIVEPWPSLCTSPRPKLRSSSLTSLTGLENLMGYHTHPAHLLLSPSPRPWIPPWR